MCQIYFSETLWSLASRMDLISGIEIYCFLNLVINEIDKQLNLIESQKISVDYELLKAASYGRLEGILYYGEMLKEIINKYPNSPRADELKGISKEINKKWKLKMP